jgi:competence protein ComEA
MTHPDHEAAAGRGDRPAHAATRPSTRYLLRAALADRLPPALQAIRWHTSARAVVGVVLVLALAVGVAWFTASRDRPSSVEPLVPAVTTAPRSPAEPTTAGVPVVIDVAGLVATPGVYELPPGSRVIDALQAAGGAMPGVSTSGLNLARVLVDGEQIAVGIPPASDASQPSTGAAPGDGGTPLDLNTATEADLDALPGVGPVIAGRIVAWRDEHGPFTSVDELLEVSGIGTATLANIAPLVHV